MVVTRFAPSPTGYLHIGSARTALFSYLYAKRHNGKFLLRIEDTDKERSTEESVDNILLGLKWLGINWDDEIVYQSQRIQRHMEAAKELIEKGGAYYCFSSQSEIETLRQKAFENKESFIFKSPWRDADKSTFPKDIKPVIRLKAPRDGATVLNDGVQGEVKVNNDHLDDMILLRSDGTPTYMMAVVVDDYDMGVTHIIRGDDHLTNAFRQILLYKAFGWDVPSMTHIPLIHGPDGHKLSKRHGAVGVDSYMEDYLPEALFNYLLRLGWSHGDDEIISSKEAISWFDIEHLGASPSRLDFDKMHHLNAHYIKHCDDTRLIHAIFERLSRDNKLNISKLEDIENVNNVISSIKLRAKTLTELTSIAKPYLDQFIPIIDLEYKSKLNILSKISDQNKIAQTPIIEQILEMLKNIESDKLKVADKNHIQCLFKEIAEQNNCKLNDIMTPVRILLTGSENFPSAFELISVIGPSIAAARISAFYELVNNK